MSIQMVSKQDWETMSPTRSVLAVGRRMGVIPVGITVTPLAVPPLDTQLAPFAAGNLPRAVKRVLLGSEDAARATCSVTHYCPFVSTPHDVDATTLRHLAQFLPTLYADLDDHRRSVALPARALQLPDDGRRAVLTVRESLVDEHCRVRARQVLAERHIEAAPVDPGAIARSLGLVIEWVDRGPKFDGQLRRERMVIEVSKLTHPHRQRFTICHEIAHFVLGHNPVVCTFNERSVSDPMRPNEHQANVFAAKLLMPEALVREHWRQLRDYRAVAEVFLVSPEAMWRRLDGLDLLGLPKV